MEQIVEYLKQHYEPLSIIVYGSYADGSHNAHSDFDALVISKAHEEFHDVSFVGGIQLDVFVYPMDYFRGEWDCEDFVQIFDGNIIMDTNGCGASVQTRVLAYLDSWPQKPAEEIRTEIEWCKKMLLRTKRNDPEGMFRWHWLLTESLEIYCDVMNRRYFGPKKSLRWMENQHAEAFACYTNALFRLEAAAMESWIQYLEAQFHSAGR